MARLLDDPAVWTEVPADLRDRVVAAATGAVAADDAGTAAARRDLTGGIATGDVPDDGRPPAPPRPASLDDHRRRQRDRPPA